MKNRFGTIFLEIKLIELLSTYNVDLQKDNPFKVWEIIKELSKIKLKAKGTGTLLIDRYLFECSLSQKENLYHLILNRILETSWRQDGFLRKGLTEYIHFIFTYYPSSKYVDFKGQLYSQDFTSLTHFFDTIETKEIFKAHMSFYKPINIFYLIDDKPITNF